MASTRCWEDISTEYNFQVKSVVMVIESASKVIAKSTEHLKGVNFSGRNIRCRINLRIMNFMFCCIDVNYVRNLSKKLIFLS